jgi:2-polyprenyl-3-methyl-5-hydroxy-6-metoxy-1,4-benzoquinol methylase
VANTSNNLNKVLYSNDLFKEWAEKRGLLPEEQLFIERYFTKKNTAIIEAGTGGGRIIFSLEKMGFASLEAFDYVEEMIAYCEAEKRKNASDVNFRVANAIDLSSYRAGAFDYLVYLQQVLCFINKEQIKQALTEAYRIGQGDAVYLFSFLNWNSKKYNYVLSILVNIFRFFRGEKTSRQELPWLLIGGKLNWQLFTGNQAGNIWFKRQQIVDLLSMQGFKVIDLRTANQILEKGRADGGHFYVACKKIPNS